jgi:hypothetical protein
MGTRKGGAESRFGRGGDFLNKYDSSVKSETHNYDEGTKARRPSNREWDGTKGNDSNQEDDK